VSQADALLNGTSIAGEEWFHILNLPSAPPPSSWGALPAGLRPAPPSGCSRTNPGSGPIAEVSYAARTGRAARLFE
jgi:hypothetical protein